MKNRKIREMKSECFQGFSDGRKREKLNFKVSVQQGYKNDV
jgi:hypothetical protein